MESVSQNMFTLLNLMRESWLAVSVVYESVIQMRTTNAIEWAI